MEQFVPFLEKSPAENYLAYLAEQPVGTGTLFVDGKQGLILHISTLPTYRKQGVARAMMHFLMQRACSLGLEKLVLYCPAPIEHFYTSLGFSKECEIEIYENEAS
jgi:ribosomal protein S18 acetylase RimI-like enzyme